MTHSSQFLMMSNPSRCVASSFFLTVRFLFKEKENNSENFMIANENFTREAIIIK